MQNKLETLYKPNVKFTLLLLGKGGMGVDIRMPIVTRGWLNTSKGPRLCYSRPRSSKKCDLTELLRSNAIVLRGHEVSRPVFESDPCKDNGNQLAYFMMDGVGGRFIDHRDEGADALIEYIVKHLVLHTVKPDARVTLLRRVVSNGVLESVEEDKDFKVKLLTALGEVTVVPFGGAAQVAPPPRKSLLTAAMKKKLMKAGQDPVHPLFKIFAPEGSATWLLCSLDADEDTLWAVCDLGMGCVEYGPVSLRELETTRTKMLGLHFERDLYFDNKSKTVAEYLELESLTS